MDDVFHAPHSAQPFRRQRSLRDGGDAMTAWSWKLGTSAGISIYLHASFLLLLAWLAVGARLKGDDARAMGESFLLITCVFGLVLLHELAEQVKAASDGISVQRAMVHEIAVVSVRDTLGLAAEHARGGFQRDFPVVDGGRVVGVLTHAASVKGLMAYGPSAPVEQVMERELVTAKPEEPLEQVLSRLPASRTGVVIVVDHQHLVGMLTAERVGEMLAVEGALHVPRTA